MFDSLIGKIKEKFSGSKDHDDEYEEDEYEEEEEEEEEE